MIGQKVINKCSHEYCRMLQRGMVVVLAMLAIFAAKAQGISVAGVDPALTELLARCAPQVNPETMAAIVSAESSGHQFAIADAGPVHLPWSKRKHLVRSLYPGTLADAVRISRELIRNGHTVSLGPAQVNDRNLWRLGISIEEIFEPCKNIAAGASILTEFYLRAEAKFGRNERALRAALSAYNSGDWLRGERDGYVDLIYRQVGKPLAIRTTPAKTRMPRTASRPSARNITATTEQRPTLLQVSDFNVTQ